MAYKPTGKDQINRILALKCILSSKCTKNYHEHVHSLLTFGGIDESGEWQYPKHKKRLCRNSKFRQTFKRIFLAGLKVLFEEGTIIYHETYEELVSDVADKQWSLFVTHPTMETKTIEAYIARYINRIAVSNS